MKEDEVVKVELDIPAEKDVNGPAKEEAMPPVNGMSPSLARTLGEIGSRIHFFRKSLKMSQEKLAHASSLDRAYISSVENGKQNITIGALLKLADALGVELTELISGSQRQG